MNFRKYKYKIVKKWRGCQEHESDLFNNFIRLFPNSFDYVFPQMPLSNLNNEYKSLFESLEYDKNYLYSFRPDFVLVKNDFYTIMELKVLCNVSSLQQLFMYESIFKSTFPYYHVTPSILLCEHFEPNAVPLASYLNIQIIRINSKIKDNYEFANKPTNSMLQLLGII